MDQDRPAIAHGNSGGLAADAERPADRRPLARPVRASLFKSCNSLDDVQGKIRPVALALPVIRAAEDGKPWKEHYLVQGTGREKLDFLGWGSTEPDSTCRAQRVPANGAVKTLYAVYDASGMTPGEDIDYIVGYRHDSSSAATTTSRWTRGRRAREPGIAASGIASVPTAEPESTRWTSSPARRSGRRPTKQPSESRASRTGASRRPAPQKSPWLQLLRCRNCFAASSKAVENCVLAAVARLSDRLAMLKTGVLVNFGHFWLVKYVL